MKGGQWSASPSVPCPEAAQTSAPPPGGEPQGLQGPPPEHFKALPFKWKKLLHQLLLNSLATECWQLHDTVSQTNQCSKQPRAPK